MDRQFIGSVHVETEMQMDLNTVGPRQLAYFLKRRHRLELSEEWLRSQADAGRIPCLIADGNYVFSVEAVYHAIARRAATTFQPCPEEAVT